MICPRCGTELVAFDDGIGNVAGKTVTHEATDDDVEHTPDRCADVLAAQRNESHANAVRSRNEMVHWRDRCKALEAERDAQPRKRIDGCQHTRRRMNEWIDESACPICLTATLGVRNNKADAFTRRVAELEEALRWYANEEAWCDGYNASRERCDHPHDNVCGGPPHQPDILIDGGALARKALAASQAPRKEGET